MLLSTRPNINDMDKGINKHRRPRLLIDTLPEDRMDSMNLDPEKLDAVAAAVRDAGRYAYERQGAVRRTFKKDGSVLTDVDMAISHSLISRIHDLFPGAAVISEEEETNASRDAEWTFILDPVDGTDVYSQGLPSFAVSLGVLDSERRPVGAYISAPRFGIATEEMMVRLDPGRRPMLNGKEIVLSGDKDRIEEITMSSKAFRYLDFSRYTGKIRVLGSSILHLLAPALFSSIEGCITLSCYVWDMASSHAVIRSLGMDTVFYDGSPVEYDDAFLIEKKALKAPLYAGSDKAREELRRMLPPLR